MLRKKELLSKIEALEAGQKALLARIDKLQMMVFALEEICKGALQNNVENEVVKTQNKDELEYGGFQRIDFKEEHPFEPYGDFDGYRR